MTEIGRLMSKFRCLLFALYNFEQERLEVASRANWWLLRCCYVIYSTREQQSSNWVMITFAYSSIEESVTFMSRGLDNKIYANYGEIQIVWNIFDINLFAFMSTLCLIGRNMSKKSGRFHTHHESQMRLHFEQRPWLNYKNCIYCLIYILNQTDSFRINFSKYAVQSHNVRSLLTDDAKCGFFFLVF